jgi:hypothetical protein
MKWFGIRTMLGLAAMLLFGACASQKETGGTGSSSTAVPGERREGQDIQPAPGMGPGAKVGF